jgi:DNA polymerase
MALLLESNAPHISHEDFDKEAVEFLEKYYPEALKEPKVVPIMYSGYDLTKCGVYKYAESLDFEILLFGYSVDGDEVQVVSLTDGEIIPTDVLDALTDDAVQKWAFNANFERVCLSRYLRDMGVSLDPFADNHHSATVLGKAKYLNPESWRCSMVWSAYMGMPLSLDGAGAVG